MVTWCAYCGRRLVRVPSKVGRANYCNARCFAAARRGGVPVAPEQRQLEPTTRAAVSNREQNDDLAVAARGYVHARENLAGAASGAAMSEYVLEADLWYHDLLLALGEQCHCDAGTCPGRLTA